ncbi:MAG: conjugal transfer protein TraF [Candidatus Poribacteria bacterium]
MMRHKLLIVGILVVISAFAYAKIGFSDSDRIWDIQYRGVRAMGMGNAFNAISDDSDSAYYNPAGMTSIRKVKVYIQPVRLVPTVDFFEEIKDINDLRDDIEAISDSSDPLGDPSLKDERIRLMDKFEGLTKESVALDGGFPIMVMIPLHVKNFGATLGIFGHGWSVSQIKVMKQGLNWADPIVGILDDSVFYRLMGESSYGLSSAVKFPIAILPLNLSVGLSVARTNRWILTDQDDLIQVQDLLSIDGPDGIKGTADDFKNLYFDPEDPLSSIVMGSGFNINAGVMASIGDDAARVGLTFRNIVGKINYNAIKDEIPDKLAGISASVNLAKIPSPDVPMIDAIVSGGIDDMNSDDSKARIGFELTWRPVSIFALSGRIGSNDGFLTLGAGLQLLFFDLDYAFYGDSITDWHALSLNLAF